MMYLATLKGLLLKEYKFIFLLLTYPWMEILLPGLHAPDIAEAYIFSQHPTILAHLNLFGEIIYEIANMYLIT